MRLKIRLFPKLVTPQDQEVVLGNFISLTTLQALSNLLPLLILPYLLRIIGPAKFGLICFAQALVQYFLILTDYGFSLTATRKISLIEDDDSRAHQIFSSVLSVKLILASVSFAVLLLLINFVPKFKTDWEIYLLSFGAVIGNTLFPVWFFQGKEKMKYITTLTSIAGIANAVCIFVYVKGVQDFIYVPLFNSLFSILAGIWGLRVAFKEFNIKFITQTYRDIREELLAGWSIFSSVVAINAYTTTRIFAVGLFTNNTITGLYSTADKIASFIQTFPLTSFTQAIYPRLSRVFMLDKIRAIKILYKMQAISTSGFIISLPILFILSPQISKIVCGYPYNEVVLTLRLLLISVFFVGANALKVQFLLIAGRPDLYAKLHLTAALISLPLIFLSIYFFSYPGVALLAIIIEIGIFITTAILLKMIIKESPGDTAGA